MAQTNDMRLLLHKIPDTPGHFSDRRWFNRTASAILSTRTPRHGRGRKTTPIWSRVCARPDCRKSRREHRCRICDQLRVRLQNQGHSLWMGGVRLGYQIDLRHHRRRLSSIARDHRQLNRAHCSLCDMHAKYADVAPTAEILPTPVSHPLRYPLAPEQRPDYLTGLIMEGHHQAALFRCPLPRGSPDT